MPDGPGGEGTHNQGGAARRPRPAAARRQTAGTRRAARQQRRARRPSPRHTRLRVKHVGKRCPYCQTRIAPTESMTVCKECGIPHHTECWNENGGCTIWGCRAAPKPAIRVAPGPPITRRIPVRDLGGSRASSTDRVPASLESRGSCLQAVSVFVLLFGLSVGLSGAFKFSKGGAAFFAMGMAVAAAATVLLIRGSRKRRDRRGPDIHLRPF